MNYIYLTQNYPNSCKLFFEWVSTKEPYNGEEIKYVDNIWFHQFFRDIFDTYCRYENYDSVRYISISKIEYVNVLKKKYKSNLITIDSSESLVFKYSCEDSFNILFSCTEILINEGLYER